MGLDNDDSSLESASTNGKNHHHHHHLAIEIGDLEQEAYLRQQEEQLKALQKAIGMDNNFSPVNSRPTTPTTNRSQHSHGSSCHTPGSNSSGNRHGMFPRTTPRTPTKSQQQESLSHAYAMKRSADTKSPRSSTSHHSRPTTPTKHHPYKNSQHELDSEAGAPTEIMTNVRRTREILVSEAGSAQPTEVMTNRTSDVLTRVRKKWNTTAREKGERQGAAVEEPSPMYTIPHQTTDNNQNARSSRVSNYWNKKKSGVDDSNIPSLMDSQSSSMSLPDDRLTESATARHSHSAHGRLLDSLGTPALQHSTTDSRLSKHVQKARQQSILSPSMSETTASLPSAAAAVVNEPGRDARLLGNRDDPIREEQESEEEQSDRNNAGRAVERRPSGNGRVAALAAQFRRTKWTIRGAQQQQQQHVEQHKKQSAIEAKIRKQDAEAPDPIISVAGSEHEGDDYNRYRDEDDESTLPEYTERHERGTAERADEFVVYNERSVRNAAAVFQSRGSSDSLEASNTDGASQGGQRRSFSQHSRASTERGKSPIQPLFSLDRVDLESSDQAPHNSGGRSMTPENFLRNREDDFERREQPRRAKSLSRSLERNVARNSGNHFVQARHGQVSDEEVPEILVFDKMRDDEDEDNSVLEEELVHIMERTGESRTKTPIKSLPYRSHPVETPTTTIRAKSPSSSGRRTPSGSGHSSVLTTKSVKDKIREFNLRTPEKWTKSPAENAHDGKHTNDYSSHDTSNRRFVRETEEEKKEDGPSAYEEDDSSVKSLRDKLEKRFAERQNSLGLDKRTHEDDEEDDYSVQSLRGKLEQRIHEVSIEFDGEDDDDRSVRSLRERFEAPVNKPKGDNVSNLRAMFESKPKAAPASLGSNYHVVQARGKPSIDLKQQDDVVPGSKEDEIDRFEMSDGVNVQPSEIQRSVKRQNQTQDASIGIRRENTRETNQKVGGRETAEELIDFENAYQQSQGIDPEPANTMPKLHPNSLSPRTNRQRMTMRSTEAPMARGNARLSSQNPSEGTKILSRVDQWANSRQSQGTKPLAKEETDFPTVARAGLHDMSPVRDGAGSPDTDALIAAVGVPGSHWASSGNSNTQQRKMLQRGDIKGASSESEYSDAVTLDASIADVSLLTNPSAIRTMGSDMDRKSDTSSSVLELLAHKSEASSSQPSEALAPLIPDPMHHKSDDSTQVFDQPVSPARDEEPQLSTTEVPQGKECSPRQPQGEKRNNRGTPNVEEPQSEWEDYNFNDAAPFRKEPPDDPFKLEPVSSDAFSDSEWPDFGDVNDFAPTGRNREATSKPHDTRWNPDPPANSEYFPRPLAQKVDPPSTPERKSPSLQQSAKNGPSVQPQHLPYTGRAAAPTQAPNRTPPRQRQSEDGQQLRYGSPEWKTSTQPSPSRAPSTTERSSSTQSATSAFPTSDYGPSHSERSGQRSPINSSKTSVTPEPSIKIPEVPPLPSPFDPNYASIMAARHKMLLSRQRALLHRRAAREQTQQSAPSSQGGFFGRTHPERPTRVAEVQPSIQLSQHANDSRKIAAPSTQTSTRPSTSLHEPWESFGPNDPTQKAFEALTRPSRHSPMRDVQENHPSSNAASSRNVQRDHPHMYSSTTQPTAPRRAQRQTEARQGTSNPSLFSKVKSTLGLESEYRTASQSEAVIARITAVRAARMKRYHDNSNAPTLSYRQRMIDREAMKGSPAFNDEPHPPTNGYRFYTHDDDVNVGRPKTFEANFSADGGDSLSTTSNAVEYAATLEVD
ncbi:MAG: hypothetical protein SGILL_003548 [Bacillariaceae sp.]